MALRSVPPDRKRGFMVSAACLCSPVSTADFKIRRRAIAHRRRRQNDGGLLRASLDATPPAGRARFVGDVACSGCTIRRVYTRAIQGPSVDKKVRLSKLTSYFWRSLSVQLRTYGLTSPPSGAMVVLTELLRQWCYWPRARSATWPSSCPSASWPRSFELRSGTSSHQGIGAQPTSSRRHRCPG